MKRFFALVSILALMVVTYAFAGLTLPEPGDLKTFSGIVTSVQQGVTRTKALAPYAEISIRAEGNTFYLKTYDLTLLNQLTEGMHIKVEVFESSKIGAKEIWILSASGINQRTYADTYALRAGEVKKSRWFYAIFCIVGAFVAFYTTRSEA